MRLSSQSQCFTSDPNTRVSQNWGYRFGGPYNKDYSILGSILGYPDFGKLPKNPIIPYRILACISYSIVLSIEFSIAVFFYAGLAKRFGEHASPMCSISQNSTRITALVRLRSDICCCRTMGFGLRVSEFPKSAGRFLGMTTASKCPANRTPYLNSVQRVLVWCQGHPTSRNSQRDLIGALLSQACHIPWHGTRWLPQLRWLGVDFCRVFYMLASLCGSCGEVPISCI